MKPRFIVIEGLEAAGKSTGIQTVVRFLEKKGVRSIEKTREPGGTILAEQLRDLLKWGYESEPLHNMTELLLMYAARAQSIENLIKPALSRGHWVVSDRHDLSSQAYQGGGRNVDASIIRPLREKVLGSLKPDFTLYLDINPITSLERARGRGRLDRIEKMDIGFFERTRSMYLKIASQNPSICTINAEKKVENVTEDILLALERWFASLEE